MLKALSRWWQLKLVKWGFRTPLIEVLAERPTDKPSSVEVVYRRCDTGAIETRRIGKFKREQIIDIEDPFLEQGSIPHEDPYLERVTESMEELDKAANQKAPGIARRIFYLLFGA